MRHVAIDCGRSTNKVIADNGYRDYFPSDIGEYRTRKLHNELRPTDIILRTQFGSFFIGDLAKDESFGSARLMTSSKVHLDTKTLIITAIARWVENGEEVILTIGVPVESHTPKTKQEMNELLLGHYVVEINGVLKEFTIKKVNISVEGASAYMALCRGQGGVKRFIDIGSRTVNYGTIINGRYQDKESGTLDYGCDTVNANNSTLSRKIAADLSKVWKHFNDETHLLGGGAFKCSQELLRFFPNLLCATDPVFTTAQAFYVIGGNAK